MPLPIDRSQGNVAALVSRFQIAADRDARIAAREARRVVSAPVKFESALGLSHGAGSSYDASSGLSTSVSASSAPSVPSVPSTPPLLSSAGSDAGVPELVTTPEAPVRSPSPPPSIAQIVEAPPDPVSVSDPPKAPSDSGKENVKPAAVTSPKQNKTPLTPSSTTKPLTHSKSRPNLRQTSSPHPKLHPHSTGSTSSSERVRDKASPQKPTVSSLAKSKSRPVSPSHDADIPPVPRASTSTARSPPVTRQRQSTPSSAESTPRSGSRLMQGTAASRARAAATRAEQSTPTRRQASSGGPGGDGAGMLGKSPRPRKSFANLKQAEKAVERAEKAVRRAERALERSGSCSDVERSEVPRVGA